jgi:putative tricarboxylic transport membrane protein
MGEILDAFAELANPVYLMNIGFGTLAGILVGVMPGLSSVMGLTILLPVTFALKGDGGILMMLGIFCGSIYGGSVTACLLNTPGTANSAATCLDGYPLATKYGQPGRALGMSTYASTFGGLFSAVMLLLTAPALAKIALKFGPTEYFGLAIFGLSIITSVSGKDIIKSLLGACIGLFLATIGVDYFTGEYRFTLGMTSPVSNYLAAGISFIPILIGLFAFSQGLLTVEESFGRPEQKIQVGWIRNIFPSLEDIKTTIITVIRSSIIGTIIGAIPGTGGDIASWIGYNEAKRWSKTPEKFGDGAIEGIAGPEAANNAISGGALIPLLTLAIPGDAGTAVMLGSLMIQGIIPGPLLFTEQRQKVFVIIFGLFVANIFMAILGFAGINLFSRIVAIPKKIMTPIIFVFCFVGTYALNHDFNDVILMIIAGIIGYFILKLGFSIPPIILGMILGSTAEQNFRRAYVVSMGDPLSFFKRPISCVFIIIAIISLMYPFVFPHIKKRLAAGKNKR